MKPNIILAGFMGVGKSTIGKALSYQLDRPFLDVDKEIERRSERTIPEIFSELGEVWFREIEAEIMAELSNTEGFVISSGGGALLASKTQKLATEKCIVIVLDAQPDELISRISTNKERPILDRPDWKKFIIIV